MKDQMEVNLKAALARVDPPEGFAGRVMSRLPGHGRRALQRWALGLAAMLALITVYNTYREERVESQRRSEQQLIFALQLTSQKLSAANERLKKASIHVSIQENL
jgi:hypothetical protein